MFKCFFIFIYTKMVILKELLFFKQIIHKHWVLFWLGVNACDRLNTCKFDVYILRTNNYF